MDITYRPYIDPEFEVLIERIHPPRVCVDNDTYHDCTLVKGLRLDICTRDRTGLLSDVTRVFRESSLSITRAEIGTRGKKAIGTFYVKDTSGQNVTPQTVEIIRREIEAALRSWRTSRQGHHQKAALQEQVQVVAAR
ncbi:UNVERIFIED_CONTAM: ACT domain-containing protein ACR5 [Sesamum angustifolium]|uniref:ACT domain-containing protein ACR n=1 Tax=Sesamum angustifolium TaxID=2727405 RepID=A0AAW2NI69_9LAMI